MTNVSSLLLKCDIKILVIFTYSFCHTLIADLTKRNSMNMHSNMPMQKHSIRQSFFVLINVDSNDKDNTYDRHQRRRLLGMIQVLLFSLFLECQLYLHFLR